MIFYFSGTGNSAYVARKLLLSDQEPLIDMGKCIKENSLRFELDEEKRIGFVFPVYFGGLPSVVREFIYRMKLGGGGAYCFAVLTYGGTAANASEVLRSTLDESNIQLNACYLLKMPANYIAMYNPTGEDKAKEILARAEIRLAEIKSETDRKALHIPSNPVIAKLLSKIMQPMYDKQRTTASFYTDDRCIGCGTCAKRCPVNAIVMENGRPKWVKEKCAHCMSCMRCSAIQYGKKTINRNRYRHPSLKKGHEGNM